jgi:hypothetical protein
VIPRSGRRLSAGTTTPRSCVGAGARMRGGSGRRSWPRRKLSSKPTQAAYGRAFASDITAGPRADPCSAGSLSLIRRLPAVAYRLKDEDEDDRP